MEGMLRQPLRVSLKDLLLLLLFLEITTPPGATVVVLRQGLHDEHWRGIAYIAFAESDFVKEEVNATNSYNSAAVCVMVKPEARQERNPVEIFTFHAFEKTVWVGMNSFALCLQEDGEHFLRSKETLRAEAWNSVCVGLTPTPATPTQEAEQESSTCKVWATLNGRHVLGGSVREPRSWHTGVEMHLSSSFSGAITGVTPLTGEEAEEVQEGGTMRVSANCSALVVRNVLTHPLDDSSRVRMGVPAGNKEITLWGRFLAMEEQLAEDPCPRKPPRTVRLQGPRGYREFLRMCRSLGGHFPTEEEAAGGLLEAYNCSTGEHLTWASGSEGDKIRSTGLCSVLLAGGGAGHRPCLSELDCALCLVPGGLTYTLFGPVKDFDRYYTLRTRPDGSIEFQGNDTSGIHQGPRGWTLNSILSTDELHQGSWVVGRSRWRRTSLHHITDTAVDNPRDGVADPSTELLLLTVCDALQFSSDDGECLPRWKRCDGHIDFPDGSDERRCSGRSRIQKDYGYDPRVNPPLLQSFREAFFSLTVQTIDKISNKDGQASVALTMHLRWWDPRVGFIYTDKKSIPCEEVWTPSFHLLAGQYSGPAVYPHRNRSDCTSEMAHDSTRALLHLEDPLMDMDVVATESHITQTVKLEVVYPCHLQLVRYPFGKYKCNLTFEMTNKPRASYGYGRYAVDLHEDIEYTGDRDLLDFRLEKVTRDVRINEVVLTLHLVALPDYHLINSFFPSSLLFLICYMSLFIPTTCFNERIMASLTALLVVVALFSQATETYVKTPYYKLIDVWYVTLIAFCFVVVVVHVFVNCLSVSRLKSQAGLMEEVRVAIWCNTACQVLLLASFVAVVVMFVLFSQDIL